MNGIGGPVQGVGVFVGLGVEVGFGVDVGRGVDVGSGLEHCGYPELPGAEQSSTFSRFSLSPSPSSSSSVVGVTVGVLPSCACVSTENAQRPNNVTAMMIAARAPGPYCPPIRTGSDLSPTALLLSIAATLYSVSDPGSVFVSVYVVSALSVSDTYIFGPSSQLGR